MQLAVQCKNYVPAQKDFHWSNNKGAYSSVAEDQDESPEVEIVPVTGTLKKDDSQESSHSKNGNVPRKHKDINFKTDILKINVCGQEHYLSVALVAKYPNTLLGSAAREHYYREDLESYYFDRNRHAFDAVMGYYLSGGVFMYPAKLNRDVVQREMHFYKIPLFEDSELPVVELQEPETFREKVYVVLNYPKSSRLATVMSGLDCALIFIAVTMLIMETEPTFRKYFEDPDEPVYNYLFVINSAIMIYFTLDYLARCFSNPSIKDFFKMVLPWLDLLSILPFYLEITMRFLGPDKDADVPHDNTEHDQDGSSGIVALRICRIFRVMRVFKFARRSENLLILMKAVGNTYKELILLSGVVSLAVLSFGSIMYTIESIKPACSQCDTPDREKFDSILKSCWWAVITVTTVGYGDMVPSSTLGKCMGSVAVFCGLIIIALPATIIVTRFSEEYEKSKMANESANGQSSY